MLSNYFRGTRTGRLISFSYYLSFIILLARSVRASLYADINSWIVTEVLVSYESGFIRRGILGQALFFLYESGVKAEPRYILAITGFVAWGAAGYLLERWTRSMEIPGRIFLLFSPLLAFFPLLDTGSFPRKDIIAISFTITHLLCARLPLRKYFACAIIGFLVLAPLATLTHEAFVFLALPVNVIVLYVLVRFKGSGTKRALVITASMAAPSLGAVLAAIAWKGGASEAAVICSRWSSYFSSLDCNPLPGSFGAIASGAGPYMTIIAEGIGTRRFAFSLILTVAFIFYHFLWLGRFYASSVRADWFADKFSISSTPRLLRDVAWIPASLTIACLGASLPLYATAVDYNRWLGVVLTCTTITIVCPVFREAAESALIPLPFSFDLVTKAGGRLGELTHSLFGFLGKYRNLSLFYGLFVTAPHCCVILLVRGDGAILSAAKFLLKGISKAL